MDSTQKDRPSYGRTNEVALELNGKLKSDVSAAYGRRISVQDAVGEILSAGEKFVPFFSPESPLLSENPKGILFVADTIEEIMEIDGLLFYVSMEQFGNGGIKAQQMNAAKHAIELELQLWYGDIEAKRLIDHINPIVQIRSIVTRTQVLFNRLPIEKRTRLQSEMDFEKISQKAIVRLGKEFPYAKGIAIELIPNRLGTGDIADNPYLNSADSSE